MRLDLYHQETVRIATEQTALLDEATARLKNGAPLSALEQSGVLHALQILIENAIGKAKQLLKAAAEPVPISAYDAFSALTRQGIINAEETTQWNAIVGLRNRIVHDYMHIDWQRIEVWVLQGNYRVVTRFLLDKLDAS